MSHRAHSGVERVVHVGLGSNLGDQAASLAAARRRLRQIGPLVAISPVYETDPVGHIPQPRYYNQVVALQTGLSCHDLLARFQQIERALGRQPGPRWGPRIIDLDILLDGDAIITDPDLIVPHPRLAERAFALIPLADIAPQSVHPVTGRTVADLAASVPGRATVHRR